MAIIGIDLGTTNSLVSVWKDNEAFIIPDALGNIMQPSVVTVDGEGKLLVAWAAKEEYLKCPERGVAGFKRTMGSATEYNLNGKTYRSEELSAIVLKKLKSIAEEYLGEEIHEAVISVPAYFDNEQRYATKLAAELAGIKCERILNEPSAAALAARYQETDEEEYMLVFDLGGGTLDVSIVDCFEEIIEITAISGDNKLGGRDFDECIARHFCKVNQIDWNDLDVLTKTRLLYEAQNAKETLTYRGKCKMCHMIDGIHGEMELDEAVLYEIAKDLFIKIRSIIEKAVIDSGLKLSDISKILLVGGSSKMPIIQKYLRKLFGREVSITGDAEELVAKGVGVYTAIKSRQPGVKNMVMTDVCPYSLGTDVVAYNSPETGHTKNFVMIERNSVLPARVTNHFCTVADGQSKIKFNIYQGENMDPKRNILIGTLEVSVPPDKAGKQGAKLTFTYDLNGILLIEAVTDEDKKYELTISGKLNRISNKNIKAMKESLKNTEYLIEEEQQKRTIMEMGYRLYENTSGELREYIENTLSYYQRATVNHSMVTMRKLNREVLQILLEIEMGLKQSVFDIEELPDLED